METLKSMMGIFNYPISLMNELGQRNPVKRVANDMSMYLMGVKVMKDARRPTAKPVPGPLVGKTFSEIDKKYLPYSAKTVNPIRPNDHYLEIMQLRGCLDLDLDDPDLKPLLK